MEYPPRDPSEDPKIFYPSHMNPRLDSQPLEDLEEMNRQLSAELDVSSSDSSPDSSPTQDQTDLKDHPEDWMILDQT